MINLPERYSCVHLKDRPSDEAMIADGHPPKDAAEDSKLDERARAGRRYLGVTHSLGLRGSVIAAFSIVLAFLMVSLPLETHSQSGRQKPPG
ncbi:MAG: hypothetical protein QOI77_1818, partial [Blastocatellia bacterium]|nr:hypothetical protein [Blastocatellia bacterium]